MFIPNPPNTGGGGTVQPSGCKTYYAHVHTNSKGIKDLNVKKTEFFNKIQETP